MCGYGLLRPVAIGIGRIGLPEQVDQMFEPFFTTKPAGKGTGLGLAICKDIIEKYNGKIVPQRREGGGTVFTVRLPLQSGVAAAPRRGRLPESSTSARTSPRTKETPG